MLDTEAKTAYEAEAQELRRELKTWETTWTREHDGAKPGRDDIKRHGDIAQKYTAYNRVRSILAGQTDPSKAASKRQSSSGDDDSRRRKRKPGPGIVEPLTEVSANQVHPGQQTPSKRPRLVGATPTKTRMTRMTTMTTTPSHTPNSRLINAVTPSISRRLFSPAMPTSIGPTPQRDGRVLGLFDVLVETEETTPSRVRTTTTTTMTTLPTTPRSKTATPRDTAHDGALGVTPRKATQMDASLLSTPSKPTTTAVTTRMTITTEADASLGLPPAPSPNAAASLQFATPAFLRRTVSLPATSFVAALKDGYDHGDDPSAIRSPSGRRPRLHLPRKPLVRGLSSVLASLRQAEDERLDEEMDLLRELEAEGQGGTQGTTQGTMAIQASVAKKTAATAVPDGRQVSAPSDAEPVDAGPRPEPPRLLGGFDDEGLYDSPPEDAASGGLDRDGRPRRVYKKKGQKRTTRLVRMRPTFTRRAEAGDDVLESDKEAAGGDDDRDRETDVVAETQFEEVTRELEGDSAAKATTTTKTSKTTKTSRKIQKKTTDASKTSTDGVKKAARKVHELAHANFKRLKLRNHGAKGGPGFGSRFRRRR